MNTGQSVEDAPENLSLRSRSHQCPLLFGTTPRAANIVRRISTGIRMCGDTAIGRKSLRAAAL